MQCKNTNFLIFWQVTLHIKAPFTWMFYFPWFVENLNVWRYVTVASDLAFSYLWLTETNFNIHYIYIHWVWFQQKQKSWVTDLCLKKKCLLSTSLKQAGLVDQLFKKSPSNRKISFLKGALDNILKLSFLPNFIYQVNIDC